MAGKYQKKISDSNDDYSTEGMMYGGAIGLVFFVIFLISGHLSYGALCIFIGVVVGMLIGMSKKKPHKKTKVDEEVEAYKQLDMKRNVFFQDRTVRPYNPTLKRPVLRTRIANGEQMAGFIDLRTGKFEEAMLISDEEDLKEFMRRYQIKSRTDIQDGL